MPNPYQTLGNAPITDDTDYLTEEIQFDIDSNMRTIAIPSEGVVIGVQGDKNVNRVNFRMPAWYNGFDMSTFQPRINFVDPEGNVNYYTVTDMKIYDPDNNEVTGTPTTEDLIYFTWLVDSYATNYVGTVVFNVRFTKFNPTTHALAQAFNTTKAACQVLEGITLADEITQEQQEDLLFHMTAELQEVTDKLKQDIEAKGAETLESIPDDYVDLSNQVNNLKNDLNAITDSNIARNATYTDGYYIYANSGAKLSNVDYCYSNKIKISGGRYYRLTGTTTPGTAHINFYDKSGTWINKGSTVDDFIVPENAEHIIISIPIIDKSNVVLTDCTNAFDYKNNQKNLGFVDGFYRRYDDGHIIRNSGYSYSAMIKLDKGTVYELKTIQAGYAHVTFYNSDLTYNSGIARNIFKMPDTATYAVISIPTGNINTYRFEALDRITVGYLENITKITQGVQIANQYGLDLYVKGGYYNLVTEGINVNGRGLEPNVSMYAIGNVVIEANLTNFNVDFSPISIPYSNISERKIEIDGFTIICNNVRYGIHDEMGGNNSAHHHIYKNITIKQNTPITDEWEHPRAIGIGVNGNGIIEIENCILNSQDAVEIDVHSNYNGNQSNNERVLIKNNVCETGTITVTSLGTSDAYKNVAVVTGNLINAETYINDSDGHNFVMYSFGNQLL